jgi:hypothetical protein
MPQNNFPVAPGHPGPTKNQMLLYALQSGLHQQTEKGGIAVLMALAARLGSSETNWSSIGSTSFLKLPSLLIQIGTTRATVSDGQTEGTTVANLPIQYESTHTPVVIGSVGSADIGGKYLYAPYFTVNYAQVSIVLTLTSASVGTSSADVTWLVIGAAPVNL